MTQRKVSFSECVQHVASTKMFSFIASSASCSRSLRTSGRNQPSPKDPGRLKTQEVLMKALIFRETGEPKSVLQLAEIPTPPLAPGEALVRVLLSPINASDLHMVRGRYGYQPELPASPGIEGVGIVEAVGPGVQGPMVGTRVVFIGTWNTWREQIVCPVDRLVPVPDGLDDPAAATSYINPLTAWALTKSGHNLKEADWLLQTAAASSVGKLVLQLAQQYRFKTINVIRRREQESIIRNLGGNEIVCTADEDLRARLQELTAGKGVERAIDCVAGELGAEIARNLAPAGTMLVFGALSSHRQTDPAKFTMPLFAPRMIYSTTTVRGWWLPRWVSSQPLAEVRAATSDLLTMLSNGALTPPTIVRYAFKDFQEAVRLADGETGQQKVLLDFSE
jgi:NADPH:quinone reductase-like Zn-dependent oxidoreductase